MVSDTGVAAPIPFSNLSTFTINVSHRFIMWSRYRTAILSILSFWASSSLLRYTGLYLWNLSASDAFYQRHSCYHMSTAIAECRVCTRVRSYFALAEPMCCNIVNSMSKDTAPSSVKILLCGNTVPYIHFMTTRYNDAIMIECLCLMVKVHCQPQVLGHLFITNLSHTEVKLMNSD